MCRISSALLLSALISLASACEHSATPADGDGDDKVKLAVVKQKEFVKILESTRGKVVLVDVWGEF
jgi:hypothetical protein